MALLPYKSVVTVPAASKDMTILATVKAELVITGTTHDVYLAGLIQQASSKAVELADREFAKETLEDSFRGGGIDDGILQLSRRPIKTVASVVEDGVTLASTDYEIIASRGKLQRLDSNGEPQCWSWKKIVVTYDGGLIMLTDESHGLERIVIDEIKRHWFARERDPLLRSRETPGVLSQAWWVDTGTDQEDPMLAALKDAGFVDLVI